MATLLLTAAVGSLGIGGFAGQLLMGAATLAGNYLDNMLLAGSQRSEGPRLDDLNVQASTEGAPIPELAGRVRLAGQIIWATRLKEVATTQRQGGKGIGGPKTTTYAYYANLAVGLCDGPIDRIGRIWADGKPLDLKDVTYRVHRGTSDQMPDPFIEGIEGAGQAPAWRGTACVVFENLALETFGNRIPQLTFEVIRRVSAGGLEDRVTAVTLIPGVGERAYDPVIQTRDIGGGQTAPENDNAGQAQADMLTTLDDLKAALPNVTRVLLVVGWFGDDLRCGSCTIRPKVEIGAKSTKPDFWQVHGLDRSGALVVSQNAGRPAYGGTPSDDSVVRAIRELKDRGYAVVFYPFVFMDIAPDNTLPDPWTGAASQPAHPWRGRITCHPAAGQPGSVDKTAAAASQVATFFGACTATQIAVSVDATSSDVAVSYSGPAEWSFRRFILHYAKLCAAINGIDPGAVEAFLVGSELRGITAIRSSATTFPGVARLVTLAADVKATLGSGVLVSYAADWSDWFGHQPGDGTGDVFFHLDPLWSSPNIDFIGIDWYAPLTDWRDGEGHLDRQIAPSIYDAAYLKGRIEAGEGYDWFYASDANRDAQTRTPITDAAHGEHWVFRPKDIRNWWLNQHRDRPAGVRNASPTAWVPQSKPVWLTELGVPSIDKGSNQPNVFVDPKSSESKIPFYSSGRRDDLIQRRAIEACLDHWSPTAATNPVSSVYGGRMIGVVAVWTWDARPWPAWPARDDVWGDADLWALGHWLNGKIGLGDLARIVQEHCARAGLTAVDVSELNGVVIGSLRDRPLSPRATIEALAQAFAFDGVETGGVLRFLHRGLAPALTIGPDMIASPDEDEAEPVVVTRAQETDLPDEIGVSFTDALRDYRAGSVSAKRIAGYSERRGDLRLALVLDDDQALAIGERALTEAWIGRETARFFLPPARIALDVCDTINLDHGAGARVWRITRITDRGLREIEAERAEAAIYGPLLPCAQAPRLDVPVTPGAALLTFTDLPLLTDSASGAMPYVAASASPWVGVTIMDSPTGTGFALDTILPERATIGETLTALAAGPAAYWDRANTVDMKLYGGELESVSDAAILAGNVNALALATPAGPWEIVQFASADLIATDTYRLSRLLRGRLGTEHAMVTTLPAGARIVLLDEAIAELTGTLNERNAPRLYAWGPSSRAPGDASWQQGTHTARAEGLRPWSPVHLRGIRDAVGNLNLSWVRHTRIGGLWADGVDVPLNEESERYLVEILSGATVVRSLTVTAPVAAYTAAQQVADFGAVQPAVTIRVAQVSASVGAGTPATATV
jgi:hypothetical protein